MQIPKKLKNDKLRFIKLRGKTKNPLEKNWTKDANYSYDEISEWSNEGNNYGVATGFGRLGVIDCDLEILDKRVQEELPETFTVETGSGGHHYYYFVEGLDEKFIFWYKGTIHAGELQWQGQQVVGAGSIHPETKKKYKVIVNKPIATITTAQLQTLFDEFKKQKKDKKSDDDDGNEAHEGFNLDIAKIVEKVPELQELKEYGDDKIQGIHPVHGSSTKFNFQIDFEKNLWRCFRCETTGDALHLIAILEGFLECDEVGSKKLKGKKFRELLKLAHDKYGYTEDELQKEDIPEEPKSLNDVHDVFNKYLYLEDMCPLDLALAVALTSQKAGTPVWLIFLGASSGTKSTLLRALGDIPKALVIDDITENTLASGARDPKTNKKMPDLGMRLQSKSTLLITPDLSSLTSHNKDAKRKIWAKFRELFDGFISRQTGNGVIVDYKDCHVTWLFGATPSIRSEVLVYAQMGTREMMFNVKLPSNIDDKVMEKAWDNEDYEEEMRHALQDVCRKFYKSHTYNSDIVISDSMKEFIKSESKRLEYLRASAPVDRNAELITHIVPAKPYRAMKQLKKIYIGLKSLDDNYSEETIKSIIKNIVDSTSDEIRTDIMRLHEQYPKRQFSYKDYMDELKVSRYVVKHQAMALLNMGYLEKCDPTLESDKGKIREVNHFIKSTKSEFKFVR